MPVNADMDDASEKKRRWHRYQFIIPVSVTIEKPWRATLLDTRASQMNDGGIALHTNTELSIGTQAKIEFALPYFDFPLTLRGLVCNRSGSQYGVEFLVTSAAEKEHLILFGEILAAKQDPSLLTERWRAIVKRTSSSVLAAS